MLLIKTGLKPVVLIDEYDKPLLDVIGRSDILNHNRNMIKGFFGILKSFDEYLQFVFITGVTKFHIVSIFSDLNQLRDISMSEEYSGICGITDSEIREYFSDEVRALADKQGMSITECYKELKSLKAILFLPMRQF